MSARLLVIDCATPALSLALFEGIDCIAATHEILGRGHAEALLPAIAAMPDGGRADAILVDVGPGSFTGVRVGVAAARALGFAWGVPVHGYLCHALVAAMARADLGFVGPVPVVMIGGHGELFWTMADADRPLTPVDIVSTPTVDLARQWTAPRLFGSGAATLVEARRGDGEAIPLLPDARQIMRLSVSDRTLPPVPVYGRGADARPMAAQPAGAGGAS